MTERVQKEIQMKKLRDLKMLILEMKKIAKELNLTDSQIIKLFVESDFEFWKKSGMEDMMERLGLQGCFVPGEPIEISEVALAILRAEIDESVRKNEEAQNEGLARIMRGPSI
jgi:hypothetical protein